MPKRTRRPARTASTAFAAVLVAVVSLAGCGGSDGPAAEPAAPSPSASQPPGLDTTEPTRPTQQAETRASATEYAEYVAELVQYAVRTRSVRPIAAEAFDQATCTTCRQLGTYVDQLVKGRYWEVGDDLRIGELKAKRLGDAWRVSGPFVYPEAKYLTVTGKTEDTVDAEDYRFSVDVRWDDSRQRWRVLDYDFLKASAKR